MEHTSPHDLNAELALLGDLMNLPHRWAEVENQITATDFYKPAHGLVFAAMEGLHARGHRTTPETIREWLIEDDSFKRAGGTEALLEIASAGTGGYKRHVETVARLASLRRIQSVAVTVLDAVADATDPADIVGAAVRDFATVRLPTTELPADLWALEEFIAHGMSDAVRTEWVIPGLLRQTWRCLLIAPEGAGKSYVLRMLAVAASQGVHPFTRDPIEPRRALIVDLENPPEAIIAGTKPAYEKLAARRVWRDGECWVWHEPGGINLRTPRHRAEFEAVVTAVDPDLICLGPLYKMYNVAVRESDELATGEVQAFLDDLRMRHRCALVMEHHAPKAVGGHRDFVPYGSSLWMRWPEFGFKLIPIMEDGEPGKDVEVKRFRGDRVEASWPDRLRRAATGSAWPWIGEYEGTDYVGF